MLWCDRCLYDSGDYPEVWCWPSVTHVPLTQRSQNTFLGVRVFDSLIFGTSLLFHVAYYNWLCYDLVTDSDFVCGQILLERLKFLDRDT